VRPGVRETSLGIFVGHVLRDADRAVGSKEESEARLEDLWWVGFVFVFVVFFAAGVGGGSFEGPSTAQGDYSFFSFFSFFCADGTRQARFESIDGSCAGARKP
jgi:hypothetical protein